MADTGDDNNTIDNKECAEETFQMDVSFDVEIIEDADTSRDHHRATSSDDSSSTSSDSDSSGCYITMETSPPSSYQSASLHLYYEELKQPRDGTGSNKCNHEEDMSEYTGSHKPEKYDSEIVQFIHEMLYKIREDAMRQRTPCDRDEGPKTLVESGENEVTKNRERCPRQKKKIRRRTKQSQSSKADASKKQANEKKGNDQL